MVIPLSVQFKNIATTTIKTTAAIIYNKGLLRRGKKEGFKFIKGIYQQENENLKEIYLHFLYVFMFFNLISSFCVVIFIDCLSIEVKK